MGVRLVDGVSTLTESDIDFSFLSQKKKDGGKPPS